MTVVKDIGDQSVKAVDLPLQFSCRQGFRFKFDIPDAVPARAGCGKDPVELEPLGPPDGRHQDEDVLELCCFHREGHYYITGIRVLRECDKNNS